MTETAVAQLSAEIARRYGSPEAFVGRVREYLDRCGISKRQLAIRAGMSYPHVLKVLGLKLRPQLQTMLDLDEAREQLVNDWREENEV